MPTTAIQPQFPFGGLVFSDRVDTLTRQGLIDPMPYVRRHICGDWGDVHEAHQRHNDAALGLGGYLLSSYTLSDDVTLCIFTEADRRCTTVFLLDEYCPAQSGPPTSRLRPIGSYPTGQKQVRH